MQEFAIKVLTEHSGPLFHNVYKQLADGRNHNIILMLPGDANQIYVWGFYDHRDRSCLVDKDNPARETLRIPASVIFKPSEEFHIPKEG